MDRRERKRLEDEINRGVPNTGIRKVDGTALAKENRSPLVKGGGAGLTLGAVAGVAYLKQTDLFHRSPLGLFPDDYIIVFFAIIVGGMAAGAAIGWLIAREAARQRKSGKVD